MKAGLMDRRVTLRRRTAAPADSKGFRAQTWADYAEVWARKVEVSGREFQIASTKDAELTVRFEIRYRTDVVATDRITCEGKDYEITQPPSEIGRRDGLSIFARAVVNG